LAWRAGGGAAVGAYQKHEKLGCALIVAGYVTGLAIIFGLAELWPDFVRAQHSLH
jgi:cytochrome bd-type quinol oxidase subunit 1